MRILYRFEGTWPLDPYCIRAELIYFWLRRGVLETAPVKNFVCICVLLFFFFSDSGTLFLMEGALAFSLSTLELQPLKGVSWVHFTAPGKANKLPLFHLETDSELCQITLPPFLTLPFVDPKDLSAGFSRHFLQRDWDFHSSTPPAL